MGPGVRIVAAVASGYLLGRRHKLRLAIAVGGLIAGKKLSTNPRQLARQAQECCPSLILPRMPSSVLPMVGV